MQLETQQAEQDEDVYIVLEDLFTLRRTELDHLSMIGWSDASVGITVVANECGKRKKAREPNTPKATVVVFLVIYRCVVDPGDIFIKTERNPKKEKDIHRVFP